MIENEAYASFHGEPWKLDEFISASVLGVDHTGVGALRFRERLLPLHFVRGDGLVAMAMVIVRADRFQLRWRAAAMGGLATGGLELDGRVVDMEAFF
jgi:hypothetical protein